MERKNMVLLTVIAVATLLVAVIGATFAFFTATVQDSRTGDNGQGETNITAGSVANKTIVANVDGAAGKFTATDVYPGHKEVAALQVTADNNDGEKDSVTDIAIKYTVTQNEFQNDEIKVSVYKSDSPVAGVKASEDNSGNNNFFGCEHKSADMTAESDLSSGVGEIPSGTKKFWEECTKSESDLTPASLLASKTLKSGTTSSPLLFEDKITAGASTQKITYYYVVLEFVNENKAADTNAQNTSMNAKLQGTITVEPA